MPTLREWRYRKAMSIVDLAKKAGVSNKTISDIENGRTAQPSFRTVRRICEALEIEPVEVIEFMPKEDDRS